MQQHKSIFAVGQHLMGKFNTYKITKQISPLAYLALNQQKKNVVVKSVEGVWPPNNERDLLKRFQERTTTLRPLLDELEGPTGPAGIVLKYLSDDLMNVSGEQRLTRPEIKYVAKNVLEALCVLHEDGYVHTDVKPSNILVNYGKGGEDRFSEVRLADLGGAMSIDSEFAIEGMIGGTSLYRSPEMHLGISWGTAVDIWSFGVTIINLILGYNCHIFLPHVPHDHKFYDPFIIQHQHKCFGPFPSSYRDIAREQTEQLLREITDIVPPESMTPFSSLGEGNICAEDQAFIQKIMKLDPRDRPTAQDLLRDEWFTERWARTVTCYWDEEWDRLRAVDSEATFFTSN